MVLWRDPIRNFQTYRSNIEDIFDDFVGGIPDDIIADAAADYWEDWDRDYENPDDPESNDSDDSDNPVEDIQDELSYQDMPTDEDDYRLDSEDSDDVDDSETETEILNLPSQLR